MQVRGLSVAPFFATVAQLVEPGFCKPQVTGSMPVGGPKFACLVIMVAHILGKDKEMDRNHQWAPNLPLKHLMDDVHSRKVRKTAQFRQAAPNLQI